MGCRGNVAGSFEVVPLDGKSKAARKSSLEHWMKQVLKEMDKAAREPAVDPVHDLRVALRRCRSMGEGMYAIDPHSSWKKMRKAGKELFASLGELRDCHVLMEWTLRLGAADDRVSQGLIEHFRQKERALKLHVADAFQRFKREQWESWAQSLPQRAARVRLESGPFQSLALERWTQGRKLQSYAMKNLSPAGLHRLRIALKKFRYVVENFLPGLYESWTHGPKEMQDVLGEIHDLDLLW